MNRTSSNPAEDPAARPRPSRILAEVELRRREEEARLTPGERMHLAFELSCNLRRLFWAGMRTRGLKDAEISALYLAGRP